MPTEQKTKRIRIYLSAITRVRYSEVVEVPEGFTDEDIQEVIDACWDEVDSGEYIEDSSYWERDRCYAGPEGSDVTPDLKFYRNEEGYLAWSELDAADAK